jgi:hypothetical protein
LSSSTTSTCGLPLAGVDEAGGLTVSLCQMVLNHG